MIHIQAASVEVCANQCGARCCRAPGSFSLDDDELARLAAHADRLGVRFTTFVDPHWPGHHRADHGVNGGACSFLDRDTNLCRVYDDRPDACRQFPQTYEPECRLTTRVDGPTLMPVRREESQP